MQISSSTSWGIEKVEKRLSQLELTNFEPSESRALLKGNWEQ